jgi:hypothetical protein
VVGSRPAGNGPRREPVVLVAVAGREWSDEEEVGKAGACNRVVAYDVVRCHVDVLVRQHRRHYPVAVVVDDEVLLHDIATPPANHDAFAPRKPLCRGFRIVVVDDKIASDVRLALGREELGVE